MSKNNRLGTFFSDQRHAFAFAHFCTSLTLADALVACLTIVQLRRTAKQAGCSNTAKALLCTGQMSAHISSQLHPETTLGAITQRTIRNQCAITIFYFN